MAKLIQVFNRYVLKGGEEASVERIFRHASEKHHVCQCFFESKDWVGNHAPTKLAQLCHTFYNRQSKAQLSAMCDQLRPDALLFHNVFPMGSPSVFLAAKELQIPIIQYVHNFRPFSVGGTLYANGKIAEDSLTGNYFPEIRAGAWQGSALKSLVLASVLTYLRRSGLLDQVKAWICISDFIRQKFIQAGVPEERLFTLRHSWDRLCTEAKPWEHHSENGYYLFLGRLVDVKGVEMLLSTWDELYQKHGDKTPHLCICGEGPMEKEVRAATLRNPAVRFRGMVSGVEKARLLQASKALIVPSIWYEPLGLVVYEAYDYGRPVISAASGGLTETVTDGETGLLYESGNVEALMQSVEKFEQMPLANRIEMAKKGTEWLFANTQVDVWKKQFHEIVAHAVRSS